VNCSLPNCSKPAAFKLSNEETGELYHFCSLAHLGAWLISRLDQSARSLVSALSTSEGRKMAVKFLADKVL
jgi:hypothetical protein